MSPSCLIEQKARSGDTGSLHSLIALSFVQFKSQTLTPAALPPPAPAHYAGRPIVLARELRDQLKWLASGYFVKASSNLLNFPPLPLLLYLSFNLFHICQRETQLSPGTPPLGMWDGGPDLVVSQGISMVLGLHGPAHCRCISMNLHKSRAEGGGGGLGRPLALKETGEMERGEILAPDLVRLSRPPSESNTLGNRALNGPHVYEWARVEPPPRSSPYKMSCPNKQKHFNYMMGRFVFSHTQGVMHPIFVVVVFFTTRKS